MDILIVTTKRENCNDDEDSGSFLCDTCHRSYRSRNNLRKHMKIHTDDAPTCEFCGKKFPSDSDWTLHLRSHTNEKPVC